MRRIFIFVILGTVVLAGHASNVMWETEPVSDTHFAVVYLVATRQNANANQEEYPRGPLTFPSDRFDEITASLFQRSPVTCRVIDIPELRINEDDPTDSVRINGGIPTRFEVYHTATNGKKSITRLSYFIPEAGAEYTIVDRYNPANINAFSVALFRHDKATGRKQHVDMKSAAAEGQITRAYKECRARVEAGK